MKPEIINLQKRFEKSPLFKPYISSIVFPDKYKNIEPGGELTFKFPLTILIGKNGTNKSSILHALYGCPEGYNIKDYWFSTHTDIIDDRSTFFYRYIRTDSDIIPEVLYTMIKKSYDPDYWETSRRKKEFGMSDIPDYKEDDREWRSKTRWNNIKKHVLYLDFRAELSSFDRAFYAHEEGPKSEPKNIIRKRIRSNSKHLKEAIDHNLKRRIFRQKERIFSNYNFPKQELTIVNKILGTSYTKIVHLEHNFFLKGGFSVFLQKADSRNYSEAFAGSGETSIARLVYALQHAEDKSLVLIDEPETSLHIAAQYGLRDYLLKIIKEKNLQVVVSTHSPCFVKDLPESAIKVLYVDENSGKVKVIDGAPADESSFQLGYRRTHSDKLTIFVEDKLSKALMDLVCKNHLSDPKQDKIKIQSLFGENSLLDQAAAEIHKEVSYSCYFFDGDVKKDIPYPGDIPQNREGEIRQAVEEIYGKSRLHLNPREKEIAYRKYLEYTFERFYYFPFPNPEAFIVDNSSLIESFIEADDITAKDPKEIIKLYTDQEIGKTGPISAESIFTVQKILLEKIDPKSKGFLKIANKLKKMLTYAPDTLGQ